MNNTGNEPMLFKELPKEQRKALRKEYLKAPEAKKMNKSLFIGAVIYAAVVVAVTVIVEVTGRSHNSIFVTFTVPFTSAWIGVISQQHYEKWLETEKNIVMKRKKS